MIHAPPDCVVDVVGVGLVGLVGLVGGIVGGGTVGKGGITLILN